MTSLMVLTGAGTPADLLAAEPALRPDHVASDLSALHWPASDSAIGEHPAWKVRTDGPHLQLAANSTEGVDGAMSALRALCAAWWSVGSGSVRVQADDPQAAAAIRWLGLD
jgi:glycerol 3-phosphatase-2